MDSQPFFFNAVRTAEVLYQPLIDQPFKKSLEIGALPIQWKQATFTLIFKKGRKLLPNNNRPISLTSQVCKTLERIVKRHIISH